MKYKGLIAMDMDGTLLQEGFYVADIELEAIRKAHDAGYLMAIATGRSAYAVKNKLEYLKLKGLIDVVIGCNGTEYLAVDDEDATILANLTRADIYEAVAVVGDKSYGFCWYCKDEVHSNHDNYFVDEIVRQTGLPVVYHDDVCADFPDLWNKAVFFFSPGETCPKTEELALLIKGKYRALYSSPTFLELVPDGADKSTAIFAVCERFNIDKTRVMGIGDSDNDIEMIRDVAFGVAMGNAHCWVKDVAKYVTNDCENGGVAQAIEVFMMKNNG